jgi:hypothetical protein
LPAVYGFINGGRGADDPSSRSVLQTWREAGQPLGRDVKFINLADAMSDPAYRDDPDIGEPSGGAFLELMMQKRKLKFPANSKPYKELEAMCR